MLIGAVAEGRRCQETELEHAQRLNNVSAEATQPERRQARQTVHPQGILPGLAKELRQPLQDDGGHQGVEMQPHPPKMVAHDGGSGLHVNEDGTLPRHRHHHTGVDEHAGPMLVWQHHLRACAGRTRHEGNNITADDGGPGIPASAGRQENDAGGKFAGDFLALGFCPPHSRGVVAALALLALFAYEFLP
jgi:hypothetical protein